MALPIEEPKNEKYKKQIENREFLNNDDFSKNIIYFFGDYLISQTPVQYFVNNPKNNYNFMLSVFQKRYQYFKRKENWSEKMMKTIIWNMCVDAAPLALKTETYKEYANKYYSGVLEDYPY